MYVYTAPNGSEYEVSVTVCWTRFHTKEEMVRVQVIKKIKDAVKDMPIGMFIGNETVSVICEGDSFGAQAYTIEVK